MTSREPAKYEHLAIVQSLSSNEPLKLVESSRPGLIISETSSLCSTVMSRRLIVT